MHFKIIEYFLQFDFGIRENYCVVSIKNQTYSKMFGYSSSKSTGSQSLSLRHCFRSFIYRSKRNGDRLLPCLTPWKMLNKPEVELWALVQDSIHLYVITNSDDSFPPIPFLSSLIQRPVCKDFVESQKLNGT